MWYSTIRDFLISLKYKQTVSDPCMFVRLDGGGGLLSVLLLYVDDVLLACNKRTDLTNVCELLSKRFDVKLLGEPAKYLGLDIRRDAKGVYVSQTTYIEIMLRVGA